MKNLKKILLLGIMLVNLMPYLKDGKMELKITEVSAQYYTIEDYGYKFLCGNRNDSNDEFESNIVCEKIPTVCTCKRCNIQYDCKSYCKTTTPCAKCGRPILCGGKCTNTNCEKEEEEKKDEKKEEQTETNPSTESGGGAVVTNPSTTGGTTSQARINLSSHDHNLDLGEPYNLEVAIEGCSVNSVTFLVDGLELQKGTSTICKLYPTKPGTFNIQVKVNDNPNLISDIEKVEVKFPPVSKISSDAIIISAMNAAKQLTTDAFDIRKVMIEHGFWIFINTRIDGCHYSVGETIPGNDAKCGDVIIVNHYCPTKIIETS